MTYPLLIAHAEYYKRPLSLLHFDAHSDTWPDLSWDSIDHGTMFYKAIKDGLIDVDKSVQIGIRTWNEDTMGVHQITAPEVHELTVAEVVTRIREIIGDQPVYLTFDIDCLDPSAAPGTGTPVIGGLSNAQALAILRGLNGIQLIGADVVEVAPHYDHSEITAISGAHLAAEMLCMFSAIRSDLV
ncbi:MAG: arginase family protein [Acidithiobacillus sp.]